MTIIMTIMMLGKNASSPVTCLDLLCCAKPCRAFSKRHNCMLTPLPCSPICFVLDVWEPEKRVAGTCDDGSTAIHGKPDQ